MGYDIQFNLASIESVPNDFKLLCPFSICPTTGFIAGFLWLSDMDKLQEMVPEKKLYVFFLNLKYF